VEKISFTFSSAEMLHFKLLDTELRFFQSSVYIRVYECPSLRRLLKTILTKRKCVVMYFSYKTMYKATRKKLFIVRK